MSQNLVGVFNDTANDIKIWNSESSGNQGTIEPATMMVIQGGAGHWNIPDCDDLNNLGNHMEIRTTGDQTMFSFWNTTAAARTIYTCPGTDYSRRVPAPGASGRGDGADVVVHVSGRGIYVLAAEMAGS